MAGVVMNEQRTRDDERGIPISGEGGITTSGNGRRVATNGAHKGREWRR